MLRISPDGYVRQPKRTLRRPDSLHHLLIQAGGYMKVRNCRNVASASNGALRPVRVRDAHAQASSWLMLVAALMGTTALVGPLATPASAQAVWQGADSDW